MMSGLSAAQRSYIRYWVDQNNWPKDFFNMDPLPMRKRKYLESTTTTTPQSSDESREEGSIPEKSLGYTSPVKPAVSGNVRTPIVGMRAEDAILCYECLNKRRPIPKNTIFRNDVLLNTWNKIENQNAARVFRDITPLLVPSAENLYILGAKHLEHVVESVNDGWKNCIPIGDSRPQPYYSVGFGASAFSEDQISKLQPYLGSLWDFSYFRVTKYMYFPFLSTEVQCSTMDLAVSDLRNAHSMAIALNGIGQLFKKVGREKELHRRILGFSFSHNYQVVEILGHYCTVNGAHIIFLSHRIHRYCFMTPNNAEKWMSYNFTRNIYDLWVGPHLEWIRSAIDDLPSVPSITRQ